MHKILIVEDDTILLAMYKKEFESEGFEVLTAVDGQMGLDMARTHKPSLVLLDIMMPKMNGIEMLDRLKADSSVSAIPVIILTNLSGVMKKDIEKAFNIGTTKRLIKSDNKPKDVVDAVKKTLLEAGENISPAQG